MKNNCDASAAAMRVLKSQCFLLVVTKNARLRPTQCKLFTQRNQRFIEIPELPVRFLVAGGIIQDRPVERGFILRIRDRILPAESSKIFATPFTHGFNEGGIAVTGEVLKGMRLTILFTHKEQRD